MRPQNSTPRYQPCLLSLNGERFPIPMRAGLPQEYALRRLHLGQHQDFPQLDCGHRQPDDPLATQLH